MVAISSPQTKREKLHTNHCKSRPCGNILRYSRYICIFPHVHEARDELSAGTDKSPFNIFFSVLSLSCSILPFVINVTSKWGARDGPGWKAEHSSISHLPCQAVWYMGNFSSIGCYFSCWDITDLKEGYSTMEFHLCFFHPSLSGIYTRTTKLLSLHWPAWLLSCVCINLLGNNTGRSVQRQQLCCSVCRYRFSLFWTRSINLYRYIGLIQQFWRGLMIRWQSMLLFFLAGKFTNIRHQLVIARISRPRQKRSLGSDVFSEHLALCDVTTIGAPVPDKLKSKVKVTAVAATTWEAKMRYFSPHDVS